MQTALISALFFIACGSLAAAQTPPGGPTCGEFELRFVGTQVEIIDVSDKGLSIGDRRIGSAELQDADGAVLGQGYFEASVVAAHGGGHRLIGDAHNVFDNGTLHYVIVYDLPDASQAAIPSDLAAFEYHVTGGTGAFAGASGTVRVSSDAGGNRIAHYAIDCPS